MEINEIKKQIEVLKAKVQTDPWRLTYHLMPETGWLNDPNGAVHFKGVYHIYHQYVPETPHGGATHWGHKTSTDLVHFKEEPIFMSPDQPFDEAGVYSGSAIVAGDEIHFFYTGNVKHPGDHDYTFSGREQNTVHVVSKDGFTIESREVVIPHEAYPEGFTDHIRDPKVFELNDVYYMILGARTRNNIGAILLYSSKNLSDWTYEGEFITASDDQGYMWECPDYFKLEGTDVLLFSPQGILPTAYQYHNPHASTYMLGEVDWTADKKEYQARTDFIELDHGFDFYAPQTFEDDQGRRIMWAWMGISDTSPEYVNPTIARGWQHALAMPRQLTIEDGQLKQRPLEEYNVLRKNELSVMSEAMHATSLQGEVYELLIDFEQVPSQFELNLRQDSQLSYDAKEGVLRLSHGESGYGRRHRYIQLSDQPLQQLRIFSDTSSLEIFVNDGDAVFTSRVYPQEGADKIELHTDGLAKVTYWDLVK
ncbi:glycoside hydrolase family 32 protein [Aerococcaceae bacterium WGS1372]